MDKDKTQFIENDEKKLGEEDISASSHPTIESELSQTDFKADSQSDTSFDKTSLAFKKEDIQKKVQNEMLDIPEFDEEEMQSEFMSQLVSKPFSHRTEEERLRINRNFLLDAEPLTLERLKEEVQNSPGELFTGFSTLDNLITIPTQKFTIIASKPEHGKTTFMLNLLINMCKKYSQKHFLYYSYGEPKLDIQIKLINMCGDEPFNNTDMEFPINNFKLWKYHLKTIDSDNLLKYSENNPQFKGLQNFLGISSNIHVMDSNYHILDLIDSIKAFNNTLPVGAVFIDFLQAIRPRIDSLTINPHQQLEESIYQLMELSHDTKFPIILGAQVERQGEDIPEYDELNLNHIKDLKAPENLSSLIIGLQNYAKSQFIGSNRNDQFKTRFFQYLLKKAEKMPESFKDKHPNTVILAKVLYNRSGPTPDVELLFNKWLMKISDFDNNINFKASET